MKSKKVLIIIIIVVTVLVSSFAFYAYQILYSPNVLVDKEDKFLYIPTGAHFQSVQDSLYEGDYVQDMLSFSFLAKLMKYDENVKPGRYHIKSNMTNRALIQLLRGGMQTPTEVTFNNVRTLEELSVKISSSIEIDANQFLETIKDTAVVEKYGFTDETIKCMFIPNTYEVYWNISAEGLIDRMYNEYDNFWNEERRRKADSIRLSPVEVSVLASIVQAETKKKEESTVIAGLYLNRLERGMLLQADPTLVYAAGDFSIKRVLNKHKEIDSPYNTYKYAGLPPGPINFPSVHSIDAVLNYDDNNYLYMCAKEDFSGYHYFTSSLRQHLNNARKFQNALNRANLFR